MTISIAENAEPEINDNIYKNLKLSLIHGDTISFVSLSLTHCLISCCNCIRLPNNGTIKNTKHKTNIKKSNGISPLFPFKSPFKYTCVKKNISTPQKH